MSEYIEPVEGQTFDSSAGKALGGVVVGLLMLAGGTALIACRLGVVNVGFRPGIFLTIIGAVLILGGLGAALGSTGQLFRKWRVIVGADRVQLLRVRGDGAAVAAQVPFANVGEWLLVDDDEGKRIELVLFDTEADGTFDEAGAIGPSTHRGAAAFKLEDNYQGSFAELYAAVDRALSAWRKAREGTPGGPKPWER